MKHIFMVRKVAEQHSLSPDLVAAICEVESGWDTYAVRYEPNWRYLLNPGHWAKIVNTTTATETVLQSCSWGLCVGADAKVLTARGYLPIKDVQVGDKVVNKDGQLDNVLFSGETGKKNLYSVKCGLNTPVSLTAEHRVFGLKSSVGKHRTGRNKILTSAKPEYIPVSELSPWDFIARPKQFPVHDIDYVDLSKYFRDKSEDFKNAYEYKVTSDELVVSYKGGRLKSKFPRFVKVDRDFLTLLGFYLAEGTLLEKNKGVSFAFHSKEDSYHRTVVDLSKKIFGDVNYKIVKDGNSCSVAVYGFGPATLGMLCSGLQPNRTVPAEFLWLPPYKQKWLLYGFFAGDGCSKHAKFTTSSETLAYSVSTMLQRLGIISCVARVEPSRGGLWFDILLSSHNNVQLFNDLYGQELSSWAQTEKNGLVRKNSTHWRQDTDFFYFPVRKVTPLGVESVYDLEIESDNSFLVNNLGVHNCQVMGTVAREHGFTGDFPELCNPEIGLEFGCKKLLSCLGKYPLLPEALASYNAGIPTRRAGIIYAGKVMEVMDRIAREGKT